MESVLTLLFVYSRRSHLFYDHPWLARSRSPTLCFPMGNQSARASMPFFRMTVAIQVSLLPLTRAVSNPESSD